MAFKDEVIDKMAALMTAAFGLVAALAWNGAIQAIFAEVYDNPTELVPMLIYAILVTIIAVIVAIMIARAAAKAKHAEETK